MSVRCSRAEQAIGPLGLAFDAPPSTMSIARNETPIWRNRPAIVVGVRVANALAGRSAAGRLGRFLARCNIPETSGNGRSSLFII